MPLLYKFRSLASCVDFVRVTKILKDRLFWFSPLWDQNDSMEAIYNPEGISSVSEPGISIAKMNKRICSFSSKSELANPLTNPLMWAHYASGFKGLVFEIEPEIGVEVYPVTYRNDPTDLPKSRKKVIDIITSKSLIWNHENERRVIKDISDEDGKIGVRSRVGEIKTILIGKPYAMVSNQDDIYSGSAALQAYRKRAKLIINIALSENIEVKIAYLCISNSGPRVEIRDLEIDDFDLG